MTNISALKGLLSSTSSVEHAEPIISLGAGKIATSLPSASPTLALARLVWASSPPMYKTLTAPGELASFRYRQVTHLGTLEQTGVCCGNIWRFRTYLTVKYTSQCIIADVWQFAWSTTLTPAIVAWPPQAPTIPLTAEQFESCLQAALPGLMKYARSLVRDQDAAQDLVQDTAVRAWRARSRFVAGTNFKAWSYRILRNCFLSDVRHKRVAKTVMLGDDLPEIPVAPDQENAITIKDVARNWRHLTDDQQLSMTLVAIEGRSYEEAATLVGVPLGTMKSRVARARQTLLALMNGEVCSPTVDKNQDRNGRAQAQNNRPILSPSVPDQIDLTQIKMLSEWRERRRSASCSYGSNRPQPEGDSMASDTAERKFAANL